MPGPAARHTGHDRSSDRRCFQYLPFHPSPSRTFSTALRGDGEAVRTLSVMGVDPDHAPFHLVFAGSECANFHRKRIAVVTHLGFADRVILAVGTKHFQVGKQLLDRGVVFDRDRGGWRGQGLSRGRILLLGKECGDAGAAAVTITPRINPPIIGSACGFILPNPLLMVQLPHFGKSES